MIYLGNPKKHNRVICTNVPNNLVFNTLQLLLAAGLTSSSFNSLTNCFGFGSPRPPSPAGPMAGRFEVRDLPLGCWVRTVHGDGEQWKCQYICPEDPCMLYMVTFTINIPPMLAYIPWILWDRAYGMHLGLSEKCWDTRHPFNFNGRSSKKTCWIILSHPKYNPG